MANIEISLGDGYKAIVSEEDYLRVSGRRWVLHRSSAKGFLYAGTFINRRLVLMHRWILQAQKGQQIDHRDANGLNNTRENIRFCTHQQNMRNRRKLKPKTSIYKGVRRLSRPRRKMWDASIGLDNKRVCLGTFLTELEAAEAYDEAARKHYGEFARTNF